MIIEADSWELILVSQLSLRMASADDTKKVDGESPFIRGCRSIA